MDENAPWDALGGLGEKPDRDKLENSWYGNKSRTERQSNRRFFGIVHPKFRFWSSTLPLERLIDRGLQSVFSDVTPMGDEEVPVGFYLRHLEPVTGFETTFLAGTTIVRPLHYPFVFLVSSQRSWFFGGLILAVVFWTCAVIYRQNRETEWWSRKDNCIWQKSVFLNCILLQLSIGQRECNMNIWDNPKYTGLFCRSKHPNPK